MSDTRFDLFFDGRLKPEADPLQARQRLGEQFKLDASGIERLFSGRPVSIKRDVDAASAARYKRVFEEAGAILTLTLIETPQASEAMSGARERVEDAAPASMTPGAPLGLAPMDGFLEEPHAVKMPRIDTSHLSLVSGPEWTLGDCEPAAPEARVPDTSHLTLAAMDEEPDDPERP